MASTMHATRTEGTYWLSYPAAALLGWHDKETFLSGDFVAADASGCVNVALPNEFGWVELFFPLPTVLAGSILTRFRVKYQVPQNGAIEAIVIRLAKRSATGSGTATTNVFASQTLYDHAMATEVFDITDETIAADTSYFLAIQCYSAGDPVVIADIGFEFGRIVV